MAEKNVVICACDGSGVIDGSSDPVVYCTCDQGDFARVDDGWVLGTCDGCDEWIHPDTPPDQITKDTATPYGHITCVAQDYIWPDPNSDGWVDAWNGWYPTEEQARLEGAPGVGRPWVLNYGEGLITEAEAEARS